VSILFFVGICSLGTDGLMARLTKTKQVIRPKDDRALQLRKVLIEKSHLIYLPIVLFFTSTAIGWDIYNADLTRTLATRPASLRFLLHTLNFLATPQHAAGILFSLTLIPGLTVITMISGIAPSIALPYFRRFKIIGVNSGPFHSNLLTAVIGPIIGLNIIVVRGRCLCPESVVEDS
jgi:hypothetical protein